MIAITIVLALGGIGVLIAALMAGGSEKRKTLCFGVAAVFCYLH